MPEIAGVEAKSALLSELAIGLSLHRLYAGGSGTDSLRASHERIRQAATTALADGPVEVEVRSARLLIDGRPHHAGGVDRLAGACFARRVEHLVVAAPPSGAELTALFEALSQEPATVAADGGVPTLLAKRGVEAILASEDDPAPESGDELADQLLGMADLDTAGDQALAHALSVELRPDDDAGSLHSRLSTVADDLPDQAAARSPFYRHATGLVAGLPADQQARFGRLVIDAAERDRFSERYLGHLPDDELAELIVRVAEHEGSHPAPLANEVATAHGRHAAVSRLTLDFSVGARLGSDTSDTQPTDSEAARSHPLAAAFPDDAHEGRQLAMTALLDFLANEPRDDQRESVRQAVIHRLRAGVGVGDLQLVTELLYAADASVALDPREALSDVREHVLDAETVSAALRLGAQTAVPVLRPFGAAAVRPLLLSLDPERGAPVVAAAAESLVQLLPPHLEVVTSELIRLPRPAVTELVAVLDRLEEVDVLPLLSRLAGSRDADVLERVVAALRDRAPATTAPVIARIAVRTDDRHVQARCLEALAHQRTDSSRALLDQLAARSSSPLPRRLRRYARTLTSGARRPR